MTALVLRTQVKSEAAIRLLQRYPAVAAKESRKALQRFGVRFTRDMAGRFRGYTGKPVGPDGQLQTRTGSLRRSITFRTRGKSLADLGIDLLGGAARGGNAQVYARTHERGAVIRPRRAKRLAIPIGENLTGAGDARFPSARDFFQVFGSSGTKEAFIVGSKRTPGNAVVMLKRGSGAVPMFVLTDQVTIPGPDTTGDKGRLQFAGTAIKLLPYLRDSIRRGFGDAIKKARRGA